MREPCICKLELKHAEHCPGSLSNARKGCEFVFLSYEESSSPGRPTSSQIVGNIKILILQPKKPNLLFILFITYFLSVISSLTRR